MDISFKHTELFGGAIVVDLPEEFRDVSTIRQVPDNQEVYLDAHGFTSIMFDLTERVSHVPTDDEALRYHLNDIVESGDEVRVWSSGSAACEKLPPKTPTLHLLASTTPPRSSSPSSSSTATTPQITMLLLLLIRLEAQDTDIVITINVPFMPGSYDEADVDFERGKWGGLGEVGEVVIERVRGSLEVRDWGLFGGAEG